MSRAVRPHIRGDLPGFRQRGLEVTRLEGFSDAVFGFALTLLVVSLDVPRTFTDLLVTMRGFPAFAICFLFLALIWNSHYKFCRRYGLDDGFARFLTCVMLFLVLFYVYPLKFLFNFTASGLVGGAANAITLKLSEFTLLMIFYGVGFAAVYLSMMFLYLHAYKLRNELELTELEKLDTRSQIWRFVILASVGILASILACFPPFVRYSSMIYLSLFPLLRAQRIWHYRRRAPYLETIAVSGFPPQIHTDF
ncbi:MAG: TMEM175 family protein [Chthoniobacterales bacterium]